MKIVEYVIKDRVGVITLNRPEKRNALSHELVADMKEAFAQAEKDEQVKVIILKANGEAFCAGASGADSLRPDIIGKEDSREPCLKRV